MERFQIDLDYLPKKKKDALQFFMDNLASTATDKMNLVCGLIFLGFRTLSGKVNTNIPMYVPVSKSAGNKIRVNLNDPALNNYLNFFDTQKSKRNCILSLLYKGIGCFEDYSLAIREKDTHKGKGLLSADRIEEDVYLSGLTQFFEKYNDEFLTEFIAPVRKINKPQDSSKRSQLGQNEKSTGDITTILPTTTVNQHPSTTSSLNTSNSELVVRDTSLGQQVTNDIKEVVSPVNIIATEDAETKSPPVKVVKKKLHMHVDVG